MKEAGVNVVRVPTGYWNWYRFGKNVTPNGPRQRLLNLQSLSPTVYTKYFNKIMGYAKKYGIKVLLDLHGLPGSQNGAMHSGIATQHPAFNTDWNKQLALSTVEAMA